MKTLIAAAVIAVSSTAALAQDAASPLFPVKFGGEVAYDVENAQVDVEVGPSLTLGQFGLSPTVIAHYNADDSVKWDGIKIEATYEVVPELTVFGNVTSAEFEYENAQVGVRFQF